MSVGGRGGSKRFALVVEVWSKIVPSIRKIRKEVQMTTEIIINHKKLGQLRLEEGQRVFLKTLEQYDGSVSYRVPCTLVKIQDAIAGTILVQTEEEFDIIRMEIVSGAITRSKGKLKIPSNIGSVTIDSFNRRE